MTLLLVYFLLFIDVVSLVWPPNDDCMTSHPMTPAADSLGKPKSVDIILAPEHNN